MYGSQNQFLGKNMRRKTTIVKIGNLSLSSEEPVMIQSMLNTSTMDTEACVEQAIGIIDAGGRLVRITAQGVKEAENLKNIRAALCERGYTTPLSADIHFNPAAAIVAARYVEKVRINPGNFADKRATFEQLEYTDDQYAAELEVLRQKFTEFLEVCREHHTAVRIGTNHGSLSDRIMSRYGNTPAGMVEATMEYLRICREFDFPDVVISLKSSDCRVMVEAVRLLVKQMEEEGMAYPLHLGVTEAGEGEDGRIRSAVGIGCLLNEGIGDTVRVSLTEAPEYEIPVARSLVGLCDPQYHRESKSVTAGVALKPIVVADLSVAGSIEAQLIRDLDFHPINTGWKAGNKAPEMIYTETVGPELAELPENVKVVVPVAAFDRTKVFRRNVSPLVGAEEFIREKQNADDSFVEVIKEMQVDRHLAEKLSSSSAVVVLNPENPGYHAFRSLLKTIRENGISNKVIVRVMTNCNDKEWVKLWVAAHTGGLFIDRLADGIWISSPAISDPLLGLNLGRNILQSVGLRRYKAEFVSCPGCGRTLYNLEEAVAKVKQAFGHLDKLKIAVMGCVVNGPGEMGDADYGYVGAGNGKVNLYKGRRMMRVAVPEQEAIAALGQLIRENGDWCDKTA